MPESVTVNWTDDRPVLTYSPVHIPSRLLLEPGEGCSDVCADVITGEADVVEGEIEIICCAGRVDDPPSSMTNIPARPTAAATPSAIQTPRPGERADTGNGVVSGAGAVT